MRILMLGWEFPPFIAGGLGTACYGLTRALDRQGHRVIFVLPKPVDRSHTSHVRMLSPDTPISAVRRSGSATSYGGVLLDDEGQPLAGFEHASFHGVPATFSSPYPGMSPANFVPLSESAELGRHNLGLDTASGGPTGGALSGAAGATFAGPIPGSSGQAGSGTVAGGPGVGYGNDLIGDSERYARLVVALSRSEDFDVIHAHDWLTYPAGISLSKVTGKPLVVHVHSTEFDRSGNNVNQRVYDIERAGMHAASRVIAVSQLTKNICIRRYGVAPSKIDVVYNGVERESQQPQPGATIESKDKIVLFLGRITMQKGPEYFIAAAKRVLEKVNDVKFVVAGSGDMALRMIELAANIGIGSKVLFTGFLRGRDVDRVYQMADCYVMPSVSEPFGISALEAINHRVPTIISKTSGAAEVLTHALKVDFWDIDEMANKIIAVLRHPPLSETLQEHGSFELHRLTWDGAAERCLEAYRNCMGAR
jgi:glycogen synthase